MRNNKTIAQPIRHLTTQPMRNHCTCNSQFPPMNFPLLLQDSPLSLASPGLPVARYSCVPNVVLRHPQITPFCWKKTTDCFKLWIPFMTAKKLQFSQEQKDPEMYKIHLKKTTQAMKVIKVTWTNEVAPCLQRRYFKIRRMSYFPSHMVQW